MSEFILKTDPHYQHEVVTELRCDPRISIADLRVSVYRGVVSLWGNVANLPEKLTAEQIVKELPFTKEVINEIKVEIPFDEKLSDSEIKKAIGLTLLWNHQVPRNLEFLVEDSWVTLTGDVGWLFQRKAAFTVISAILGIKGITNSIKITTIARSNEIKNRIEKAIRNSSSNDPKTIQIHVEESLVTMTGYVRTYSDIEKARRAAWSAPGILIVENRLQFAS